MRRSRRLRARRLVAAAILAVLLGLAVFRSAQNRHAAPAPTGVRIALLDLQERSQHLDVALRALDRRPLRGWQAASILALEDELAQVDLSISSATAGEASSSELDLWQRRLQLQDALFRIHVEPAETANL